MGGWSQHRPKRIKWLKSLRVSMTGIGKRKERWYNARKRSEVSKPILFKSLGRKKVRRVGQRRSLSHWTTALHLFFQCKTPCLFSAPSHIQRFNPLHKFSRRYCTFIEHAYDDRSLSLTQLVLCCFRAPFPSASSHDCPHFIPESPSSRFANDNPPKDSHLNNTSLQCTSPLLQSWDNPSAVWRPPSRRIVCD